MIAKIKLSSSVFIMIVSIYFAIVLDYQFLNQSYQILQFKSFSDVLFVLSFPLFVFVPLYLLFNLITIKYVGKLLIVTLLICSSLCAYAMQYLGMVMNASMIGNIMETNYREVNDLVTNRAIVFVLITGIIPAVFVCLAHINYAPVKMEISKRLKYVLYSVLGLAMFAPVTYKSYASYCRNNSHVSRSINTFNYIVALGKYYRRMNEKNMVFKILDNEPIKVSSPDQKPRVFVLVVGETARAKNFSLYGYEKETNPKLKKNNEIITFRNVTSCGTATAISVPCMFSASGKEEFDKKKARYTQNLMDIINLSGYKTLWLDNDDGCKNVCDRIPYENMQKKTTPDCFSDYCYDGVFLSDLDKRLETIKEDSVIVLHAMGSHGPTYYKRYPEEFKKFTPTCDTADLQNCTDEQIRNTYDNTIVYTDYIISSVIDILKKHDKLSSGMLYASDHGESLGEHHIYLHAFPYDIAPREQKEIPMIMWLSDTLQKDLHINEDYLRQVATNVSFTHDNYFHTVLRLLSIKTSTYNKDKDILSRNGVINHYTATN